MSDDPGIVIDEAQPCFICLKPCTRIDLDFEGPLHFTPCRAQAWSMYTLELSRGET